MRKPLCPTGSSMALTASPRILPLLKHPFYKASDPGNTSRESLQLYAQQTLRT